MPIADTCIDELDVHHVKRQEQPVEKIQERDDWEHHPNNPRNWSSLNKWTATSLVSLYTFVTPLAGSMMVPGLPDLAMKYGITNPTILALTLSILLLSFAIGPLFLGPLSEMYGRTWVLHIGNLAFLCFNLGYALAPTTSSPLCVDLLLRRTYSGLQCLELLVGLHAFATFHCTYPGTD